MTSSGASRIPSRTSPAQRRSRVDPADCLVIEDAPAGIPAGKTAGMTVIALVTTFEASALGAADYVVGSLADVALGSATELSGGGFTLELALAEG